MGNLTHGGAESRTRTRRRDSRSSLTAGGGELCDEELPNTLEPSPEVIDERPEPVATRIDKPQAQRTRPCSAALVRNA